MSILVKDMKMPTRCLSCQMCYVENEEVHCEISHGYYIECRKVDTKIAIQERPSWCPLVEVPEDVQPVKHGRWINICGDSESMRQCSECLQDFDYIDGICYLVSGQRLPLYCPNCGAKMDGAE